MIAFEFTADMRPAIFSFTHKDKKKMSMLEVPLSLYVPFHLGGDELQRKIKSAVTEMVGKLNREL